MANIKMAAVIPKAVFTGFRVLMKVVTIRKRADKASKIFEKTLLNEGMSAEQAAGLARVYRDAIPIPRSFTGLIKEHKHRSVGHKHPTE